MHLLGSSAGSSRHKEAPGGGGKWKLVKVVDGVMTAELRDGAMYGVRAMTTIRRPAATIAAYLSELVLFTLSILQSLPYAYRMKNEIKLFFFKQTNKQTNKKQQ